MAPGQGPPGHFTVLYFAAAASFTGRSTEHVAAPVEAGDLFAKLEALHPGIGAKVLESCAVTVNLDYIDVEGEDAPHKRLVIKEGDEVAIIPPVSSG
jgi:molybdopterin converting factor small subunit